MPETRTTAPAENYRYPIIPSHRSPKAEEQQSDPDSPRPDYLYMVNIRERRFSRGVGRPGGRAGTPRGVLALGEHGWVVDNDSEVRLLEALRGEFRAYFLARSWYPVRDLNPCYHLERVAS